MRICYYSLTILRSPNGSSTPVRPPLTLPSLLPLRRGRRWGRRDGEGWGWRRSDLLFLTLAPPPPSLGCCCCHKEGGVLERCGGAIITNFIPLAMAEHLWPSLKKGKQEGEVSKRSGSWGRRLRGWLTSTQAATSPRLACTGPGRLRSLSRRPLALVVMTTSTDEGQIYP